MESHSFSQPKPLTDRSIPTWQVDVLRQGQLPVGTLILDENTFPPRNRKNKIVWKLPENYDTTPTFGEHEKKRLWELFKQQKKERRKSKKSKDEPEATTTMTSPEKGDSNTNTEGAQEEKKELKQASPCPEPPPFAEPTTTADSTPPQSEGEEVSNEQQQPSLPPPPPGFDFGQMSIQDPPQPPAAPPEAAAAATAINNPLASMTPRYFLWNPTEPPATMVTHVASTYVHCLSTCPIDWLSYYTPTASKTLLMGRAQAICATAVHQLQQVQSLQSAYWTCQGFTMQTVDQTANLLIVLNGRTVQKGEALAYNLTVLLQPVEVATTTPTATRYYQIQNDVLSLFPTTTTTTTTT